MTRPSRKEQHYAQKQIAYENRTKILLDIKKKESGINFNELRDAVDISGTQLSKHLDTLLKERLIRKEDGQITVKDRHRNYKKDTKVYLLTDAGKKELESRWLIEAEIQRIKLTMKEPDRMTGYRAGGEIFELPMGCGLITHHIHTSSKEVRQKNIEVMIDLETALTEDRLKNLLTKICMMAYDDHIIPYPWEKQDSNFSDIIQTIAREYLMDDNAEIIISSHLKFTDFRNWLLSSTGQDYLSSILKASPIGVNRQPLLNFNDFRRIVDIQDEKLFEQMKTSLKDFPIPVLPLVKLQQWFQNTSEGRKYLHQFNDTVYEGTEEDITFMKEHMFFAPWELVEKWLYSTDGQRYVKALVEVYPFPDRISMFILSEGISKHQDKQLPETIETQITDLTGQGRSRTSTTRRDEL